MEGVLNFLQTYVPALVEHKYLFLFLGAVFEGLNTMVLAGFLASVKAIKFWPMFWILVGGYIANGYMWYLVGYIGGSKPIDRWVRKDEKGERIMNQVDYYFHKYSGRAIVLTKFTFSLTIATLIMAGSLKYNLKRFSWYNFWGSIGWVALTMAVGYFFGESYKFFFVYIINFTYFVIFLAAAITLTYLFKYFIKKKFVKRMIIAEKIRELGDKFKKNINDMMSEK